MSYKTKPEWIKVKALSDNAFSNIYEILKKYDLNTVCSEAKCPNINECWSKKTATFLLLGNVCSRSCLFCSVQTGNQYKIVDHEEPYNIAQAVKELNLSYVVLTSVTRDDLEDGGAKHFAKTISEIKKYNSSAVIEALIPDFQGDIKSLETVINSGVDVIGHNIETVKRITKKIRGRKSDYMISLDLLKIAKSINPKIITKSSLQLGFGEKEEEVKQAINDLKDHNVNILTLGQYLRPTKNQIPVMDYIKPEKFEEYEKYAKNIGFSAVFAGSFVRSSYKASDIFADIVK